MLTSRAFPSRTMRKPMGSTFTPAPLPPHTQGFAEEAVVSLPPEANPKVTRETGMEVIPSGVVIGAPITVFVSTMERILSMAVSIILPSG